MKNLFFILLQYLLPQHLLSRVAGTLAESEITWIKDTLISFFIKKYDIDMSVSKRKSPFEYQSFNDFFTRQLDDGLRKIENSENVIISPADGAFSQIGDINDGEIIQAKGKYFSLSDLIGQDKILTDNFINGTFCTIYLSPRDYHRVHMPISGKLTQTIYIPGKLFSVNQLTAEKVPDLFARNERLVCIFDTATGPIAVILVGAMIVASIETVWQKKISEGEKNVQRKMYDDGIYLEKGAELGRFKLGSTVIMLLPEDTIEWQDGLKTGTPVEMGSKIATIKNEVEH